MRRGRAGVVVAALAALMPASAAAQGWIEPLPLAGPQAVEKTRSQARVRLNGRVAEVVVTEWFLNRGAAVAEGNYLYPLPGEAVFQGFSLFQGDAELRGEIMDARQARSIYEEIVRRRRDPALIELAGQGLLRARVFPIEPGQERKVTLRYTQVLELAGNALQLQYAGGATDLQVVADDGDAFLDPFSPTHTVDVRRDGGRLTVGVNGATGGRLSLFFPLAGEELGVSVATHRPVGEDGYFMLTLSPGRETDGVAQPRDVTVVLDVSGSMSGEKMEQARSALHGLLNTLAPADRFRLVSFSNQVRRQAEGWTGAQGAGLAAARRWVDGLAADGGTNMGAALDEAFRLESPGERLPMVIFLTDGLPSVGEQSPERLADLAQARAGRIRVFAFGVGHDVNTHLLDRLSEAGRGTTEYVQPGENVERAVTLLATKVRHPVLTDVELDGAPVRLTELYPVTLPDVFAGEELIVFGRYRGQGSGTLGVRGRRAGRTERFETRADFPRSAEANAFIPRLWASRKLGHLTRQIWTEGETDSLVEEIRTLALRYGLPSPYTSYLVQEPEVVADGAPRPVPVGARRGRAALGAGQAVVAPTTPSSASGATAVALAKGARRMRDAASEDILAEEAAELEARVALAAGGPARVVAGRIFRNEDGVWTDVAHRPSNRIVKVQAFSAAYFGVLWSLSELKPVLRELGTVLVAGEGVSLLVGDEGTEALSEEQMREIVTAFRGRTGAP